MVQKKHLKILAVILKYDYGDIDSGISLEKRYFEPALIKNCNDYYRFYYDVFLDKNALKELQTSIKNHADKFKPDIIFFNLLRDEISFETLDYLKKRYKTVNWFSDDHWRFDTFTKDYAPHFTYSITTYEPVIEKYNGLETIPILASWGVDEVRDNIDNPKYKYDVSFVGSKSKERERIIKYLKKNNINVHTFGSGWDNGRVSFEEMKKIFFESKINLNLSNSQFAIKNYLIDKCLRIIHSNNITDYIFGLLYIFLPRNRDDKFDPKVHDVRTFFRARANIKNKESLKARHFEICGAGGFQLSFPSEDLESCFDKNEVGTFNYNKIVYDINLFIEYNEYRNDIRKRGYEKVKKNYTYDKIFKRIIEEIK